MVTHIDNISQKGNQILEIFYSCDATRNFLPTSRNFEIKLQKEDECLQSWYPECADSEIFCSISSATQKSQVGAAYILSTGASCTIPLGECVNETQASVYALLDVCNLLSNSNLNGDSITIFMDS